MAFSFSRMSTWLQCPAKYKAKYIDKTVPTETSAALEYGKTIHEGLERAIKHRTAAPQGIWTPPGLMQRLQMTYGTVTKVEEQMAIDEGGREVDWYAPNAVLRGAMDVWLHQGNESLVLDWKTGKVRPNDLQPDVYATLVRSRYPKARVTFSFVYLQHKKVVEKRPDKYACDRVLRIIEQIEADTTHTPRPSALCRWCSVRECEYWTEG